MMGDDAKAATGLPNEIPAAPLSGGAAKLFWLCAFVLLVIFLWPDAATKRQTAFAPAAWLPRVTSGYAEVRDFSALNKALTKSKLWQDKKGTQAVAAIRGQLLRKLAMLLGNKRKKNCEQFARLVLGMAVAVVPLDNGKPGYAFLLKVPARQDAELDRPLSRLRDMDFLRKKIIVEGKPAYRLTSTLGEAYLVSLPRCLVITTDKVLLEQILEVRAGEGDSLARNPAFRPPTSGAKILFWATGNLQQLRPHFKLLDWVYRERIGATSQAGVFRLLLTMIAGLPQVLATVDCPKMPTALRVQEPLREELFPAWLRAADEFRKIKTAPLARAVVDGKQQVHFQIGYRYPQNISGGVVNSGTSHRRGRGIIGTLFSWLKSLGWLVVYLAGGIVALFVLLVVAVLLIGFFAKVRSCFSAGDNIPHSRQSFATSTTRFSDENTMAGSGEKTTSFVQPIASPSPSSLESIERAAGGAVGLSESALFPDDDSDADEKL